MQTETGTNYMIQLTCGVADGGMLNFSSASGATDEFVVSVADALRGLTYPSGEGQVNVYVSKVSSTTTSGNLDWTANPPAFT